MERRNRLKKLRIVMMALTGMICVRAFLWCGVFLPASGSSIAEAAEKEPEAGLAEVTWEDYQSGREMDPVILHFSFYDGKVIDREMPYYPSIVEKTEYLDITGDGREEMLVYRYFANTATEYTLIDVFEIENGTVSCISPENGLEELAGNVWDMRIDGLYAGGEKNPVFRMTSYRKENGIAFSDETLLVAYEENGWRIFRRVSWEIRYVVWKVKEIIGKENFYGR